LSRSVEGLRAFYTRVAVGFVGFGISSFILRPAGMCLAEWVPVRHNIVLT
jgi:hypothetical protein